LKGSFLINQTNITNLN